ncbi:MAG: hypothetical protein K2Y14_07315 [Burkholderiales bacterium]|nr:hypothetical protein [Burkholderiales bacterium]
MKNVRFSTNQVFSVIGVGWVVLALLWVIFKFSVNYFVLYAVITILLIYLTKNRNTKFQNYVVFLSASFTNKGHVVEFLISGVNKNNQFESLKSIRYQTNHILYLEKVSDLAHKFGIWVDLTEYALQPLQIINSNDELVPVESERYDEILEKTKLISSAFFSEIEANKVNLINHNVVNPSFGTQKELPKKSILRRLFWW